jgi:kelch-like protein 10
MCILNGAPDVHLGHFRYYSGLIYLAGGLNELNVELKSVDCYNPVIKQWTTVASMKTKRAYFGLVVLNGYLYAVGGWNEHDGALASVEKYSADEVHLLC